MFQSFSGALQTMYELQKALDEARNENFFGTSTTSRGVYPAVNLFKKGDDLVLTAELPGMQKEQIQIEIKDNLLRLHGERAELQKSKDVSVHRAERRGYKFDRTLRLPMKVEIGRVKADYKDGVLTVDLPQAEVEKPRAITVQ